MISQRISNDSWLYKLLHTLQTSFYNIHITILKMVRVEFQPWMMAVVESLRFLLQFVQTDVEEWCRRWMVKRFQLKRAWFKVNSWLPWMEWSLDSWSSWSVSSPICFNSPCTLPAHEDSTKILQKQWWNIDELRKKVYEKWRKSERILEFFVMDLKKWLVLKHSVMIRSFIPRLNPKINHN